MKIKFFYRTDGEKILYRYGTILEKTEKYCINHSRYLLNFLIYISLREIKFSLENIKKIERDEIKVSESAAEIPDIYVYIYKEKTLFEHNLGCYDNWECPTIVLKQALEGCKKFLEMPKDKDTTYEFEIPDSDL